MTPNPSYYNQFNGYTLGLLSFILGMRVLRAFGVRVLARFTLRRLSFAERTERTERFRRTILSQILFVLYLAYPGVSVAIFGMFACTSVTSGVAYLNTDVRIICYTPTHNSYLAAGVLWVFVFTVGIPAYFLSLLVQYKVPILARELANNAWLREVVKASMLEGLPRPPGGQLTLLTTENISMSHLEALYAFFLRGVSPDVAVDIMCGRATPLALRQVDAVPGSLTARLSMMLTTASEQLGEELDADDDSLASFHVASAESSTQPACNAKFSVGAFSMGALKARAASLQNKLKEHLAKLMMRAAGLLRALGGEKEVAAGDEHRAALTAAVLRFARDSGVIAIPDMRWEEKVEEPEEKEDEEGAEEEEKDVKGKQKKSLLRQLSKNTASERQAALRKAALRDIGFLFAAYTPVCYYWEIVELGRKLALTSIVALIAPGSGGQVVVSLLLAFFMLQVVTQHRPYIEKPVNAANQQAQLTLTMFLLVALLLKVNVDNQAQSGFFSFIISALSAFPIAFPIAMTLYSKMTGGEEGEEADIGAEDQGFDTKEQEEESWFGRLRSSFKTKAANKLGIPIFRLT